MNLEEYLEALQRCPDDELVEKLGVYDNYTILMNADVDTIVAHFSTSDQYERTDNPRKFNFRGGNDAVQIKSPVPGIYTTGFGFNNTPDQASHSQRQIAEYTVGLSLHAYQTGRDKEPTAYNWRTMANMIIEIGKYILRENIPACLPSVGNNLRDVNKTIYFQPAQEAGHS